MVRKIKSINLGFDYVLSRQSYDGAFDVRKSYGTVLVVSPVASAFPLAKREIQRALNSAITSVTENQDVLTGFWRFIPLSKPSYELPLDLGTTSLVLIALTKSRRASNNQHAEKVVQVTLDKIGAAQLENGGFYGWFGPSESKEVVPAFRHSPIKSIDPEVVATTAQAFHTFDSRKYGIKISHGWFRQALRRLTMIHKLDRNTLY